MKKTDRTATVVTTGMAGVRTKYYGPGNVHGSHIVAWRADMPERQDTMRVTVSWDYSLNTDENHAAAVQAYLDSHIAAGHGWDGTWLLGAGDDGYVAVHVPREAVR